MPARRPLPAPQPPQRPTRVKRWRLTPHAKVRADELGFAARELLEAAEHPDMTYQQSDYGPQAYLHVRGDVAVAVNRASRTVVTVLLRRYDRWEHGRDRRTGPAAERSHA